MTFDEKIKERAETEGFVGAVRYARIVKKWNLPTAKAYVEKVLGRDPSGTK